jgi:hypothetical protein
MAKAAVIGSMAQRPSIGNTEGSPSYELNIYTKNDSPNATVMRYGCRRSIFTKRQSTEYGMMK